jgi:hypothetical protein
MLVKRCVTVFAIAGSLCAQSKLPKGDGAPAAPRPTSTPPPAANSSGSSPGPSSGQGFYKMKMVKFLDNQGFGPNVEVSRFLIPADWRTEGEVHWVGGHLGCPYNIIQNVFKATSPDGLSGIEVGPGYAWASSSDPGYMKTIQQIAAQGQGCDPGPVLGPAEFLQSRILPKYRPGARILGAEPLPALSQARTAALLQTYGPLVKQGTMRAAKVDVGRVHISYTKNGQSVEEWVSTTIDALVNPTPNTAALMQGQMRYTESVYALTSEGFMGIYAPAGKFDKKLAATIVASIRGNPAYSEAVGQFLLNMGKVALKGAMDRQKIWHEAQQQISATINESYRKQQAVQDKMAEQFDQVIRGVETYVNPSTGQPIELTGGYNRAFTNALGEYILSDSASFNPNQVLNGNWTELKKGK